MYIYNLNTEFELCEWIYLISRVHESSHTKINCCIEIDSKEKRNYIPYSLYVRERTKKIEGFEEEPSEAPAETQISVSALIFRPKRGEYMSATARTNRK
jgi:hypothetical protein